MQDFYFVVLGVSCFSECKALCARHALLLILQNNSIVCNAVCSCTHKTALSCNQTCCLFCCFLFVCLFLQHFSQALFALLNSRESQIRRNEAHKEGFCTPSRYNRPWTHKPDRPIRCIKLEYNWPHVSSSLSSVLLVAVEAIPPYGCAVISEENLTVKKI